MSQVTLLTLDPGHFHAALVQKNMYSQVSQRSHVFAPLGKDLLAHLGRIAGFNGRSDKPTCWELDIRASSDFLTRMLTERPGNVVILSGRNHRKIEYLEAVIEAGLHVLADKPWIIESGDLPRLESVLNRAQAQKLIAYDIMTERHEITSILQRVLVRDEEIFGRQIPGTSAEPGILLESKHHIMKSVAGVPLLRPASFFDVNQQGEGLTDVGTHLVDLVAWIVFPNQGLDDQNDVRIHAAERWPTRLSITDFQRVTGEERFPEYLAGSIRNSTLDYFCNNCVRYSIRGVHVTLNVLWDFECKASEGDTHLAIFRGSEARIEIRQGAQQNYRPELYVVPEGQRAQNLIGKALQRRINSLQSDYPGIQVADHPESFQILIPDRYRIGHEAHFAEVTNQFLTFLEQPALLPAWEKPNMIAKYRVTTEGVAMARKLAAASGR